MICSIPLIVHGSNMDFTLNYFEICFIYEINGGDKMFHDLNFFNEIFDSGQFDPINGNNS